MPDSENYRRFVKQFVGASPGDFVWCMHCEQTFKWDGIIDRCPNDCDGNPIDWREWKGHIKEYFTWYKGQEEIIKKEFPREPIPGVVYPLYPPFLEPPKPEPASKGKGRGKA